MDIEQLRDRAIDVFRGLFRAGEICHVAFSGGKDSSVALNLCLEAALAHRRAGETVPPILVLHVDTRLDNPSVRAHCDRMLAQLRAFSQREDLPVTVEVAQPALREEWVVQVVSGRRLPTFANRAHRRCTIDLKVTPARRAVARQFQALEADGETRLPVTVLGTRFEESTGREQRMRDRGESPDRINETLDARGEVVERTISPIAEWTLDDVWEYLQLAGEGRPFEAFARSFDQTVEIYRDSAGECVVLGGADLEAQRAPCGGRHGCWACTVAGSKDKSMETMLEQPQYAYMRRLNALRDWFVATQHDFSLRRWISRQTDPVTGYIPIIPADYSASTCRWLLKVMLSIDCEEQARAEAFARLVAEGQADSDPGVQALGGTGARHPGTRERVAEYIERMQKPQFQLIRPESLIAIDFHWSVDALLPPFEALRVWDEVVRQGERVFAPEKAFPVPQAPVPPRRWLPAVDDTDHRLGIHGVLAELGGAEACGVYAHRPVSGPDQRPDGSEVKRRPQERLRRQMSMRETERFDVDPEGAELFLAFEADAALETNRAFHEGRARVSRTQAALAYVRYGVVAVSAGHIGGIESMIHRGQVWERHGLSGDVPVDALLARCVPEAEHNAERARAVVHSVWGEQAEAAAAAADIQAQAVRFPGLGWDAAEIRALRARLRRTLPGLIARHIAWSSAAEAGIRELEGWAVSARVEILRRDLREWRRTALEGPHARYLAPLYHRISATVHRRAAEVLLADEADPARFAHGFGLALQYQDAPARAAWHRAKAAGHDKKCRGGKKSETEVPEQLRLFAA